MTRWMMCVAVGVAVLVACQSEPSSEPETPESDTAAPQPEAPRPFVLEMKPSSQCEAGDGAACFEQAKAAVGNVNPETSLPDFASRARFLDLGCKAGHTASCVEQGIDLLMGNARLKDLKRAEAVLEPLCQDGDQRACAGLGWSIFTQVDDRRLVRGSELFENACKAGDPLGCTFSAFVLFNYEILGRVRNEAKGASQLENQCEEGEPVACAMLAQAFGEDRDSFLREEKVHALAHKACAAGLSSGCVSMADSHWRGDGVAMDEPRALRIMVALCEAGEPEGCKKAASYWTWGGEKSPMDEARGAEVLDALMAQMEAPCKAGNPEACLLVEESHADRRSEAAMAHREALFAVRERLCELNVWRKCTSVASVYETGFNGWERDPMRGHELRVLARAGARRECNEGLVTGCIELSEMMFEGIGGDVDTDSALRLMTSMCDEGVVWTCSRLYHIHSLGRHGVVKNAELGQQLREKVVKLLTTRCDEGVHSLCPSAAEWMDAPSEEVLPYHRKACDAGYTRSCKSLLEAHSDGSLPLKPEALKAVVEMHVAQLENHCASADGGACAELASMLERGEELPADPERAKTLRERAGAIHELNCKTHDWSDECVAWMRYHEHAKRTAQADAAYAAARAILEEECEWGYSSSCHELAESYERPLRGEPDLGLARGLYEKSCALNSTEGCSRLFAMAIGGEGGEQDIALAVEAAEQRCRLGDAWECYGVLNAYDTGLKDFPAVPARAKALRKALLEESQPLCDAGVLDACEHTGRYLRGLGRKEEGSAILEKTCEEGHPGACSFLKRTLRYGDEKDQAKAVSLYEKSCLKGNADDCFTAAAILHRDHEHREEARIEALYVEARRLFDVACTGGDSQSCHQLAGLLNSVNGGEVQAEKARAIYDKLCGQATDESDPVSVERRSCGTLVGMLSRGEGGARDMTRALAILETECKRDKISACSDLADVYSRGDQADLEKAKNFRNMQAQLLLRQCQAGQAWSCRKLEELIKAGDVDMDVTFVQQTQHRKAVSRCDSGESSLGLACFDAGMGILNGLEGEPDIDRARSYLKKACHQDFLSKCVKVAGLLEKGSGPMPASPEHALEVYTSYSKWMEAKCGEGDIQACSLVAVMYHEGKLGEGKRGETDRLYENAVGQAEKACKGGDESACRKASSGIVYWAAPVSPELYKSSLVSLCEASVPRTCEKLEREVTGGNIELALPELTTLLLKSCTPQNVNTCRSIVRLAKREKVDEATVTQARRVLVETMSKGCEKGEVSSCMNWATYSEDPEQVKAAYARVVAVLEPKCEKGRGGACGQIAELHHFRGDGSDATLKKARSYYTRGCNAAKVSISSCMEVHRMMTRGKGGPVDEAGADAIHQKMCADLSTLASYQRRWCERNAPEQTPEDEEIKGEVKGSVNP